MQITYKGKKHQIKCDDGMPMYAQDGTELECCQPVNVCKQCILKHLGSSENKGWDDEENISYDMHITIGSNSVSI